jgi:bacteriorhodopsin
MLACTIYTLVSQHRVLPKYRNALVMSSMVTFIAGYHYLRIFDSFGHASKVVEGTTKMSVDLSGAQGSFNEAYRYVDWLLTVPLLLVEVIAVLALTREVSRSLIMRLVPASAAMIALGYPGEIATGADAQNTQVLYGVLSTIPFLYILYVLFVELSKSLDRQPAGVAETIGRLRLLLIATWGVYPIAYIFNIVGDASESSFVTVQVGYTVADVLAKCVFGLTILKIARMKSMAEGMKDDH